MRYGVHSFATFVAVLLLSAGAAFAAPKNQTYTGQVSDAMCGAKHQMPSAAECTRACVKQGSKYALVVGDKVYTLQTDDKTALANLDKLAGEKATISGSQEGDTIKVASVSPAK